MRVYDLIPCYGDQDLRGFKSFETLDSFILFSYQNKVHQEVDSVTKTRTLYVFLNSFFDLS